MSLVTTETEGDINKLHTDTHICLKVTGAISSFPVKAVYGDLTAVDDIEVILSSYQITTTRDGQYFAISSVKTLTFTQQLGLTLNLELENERH